MSPFSMASCRRSRAITWYCAVPSPAASLHQLEQNASTGCPCSMRISGMLQLSATRSATLAARPGYMHCITTGGPILADVSSS
jgi:hypothetical protein